MRVLIGQVITQILAFLFMLWVLKRYAWKPILKVMDDRRNRIQSEFDSIDEQKAEIDKIIADYKQKLSDIDAQANAKINEAIVKGRDLAHEIQKDAQKQAKTTIEKAQKDALNEIKKAKVQLKNEIVDMTLAATEKILKENLNEKKQKDLVLDFVKQMENE